MSVLKDVGYVEIFPENNEISTSVVFTQHDIDNFPGGVDKLLERLIKNTLEVWEDLLMSELSKEWLLEGDKKIILHFRRWD